MIIIGLTGKKNAGKDTICDMVMSLSDSWCRTNNYIAIKVGFADELYIEVASGLLGTQIKAHTPVDMKEKMIQGAVDYIKANKPNFRLILQGWGTDYRRNLCDENYWVSKWTRKVSKFPDDTLVIVPDVRFNNEMEALGSKAHVWRVSRVGEDCNDKHASENEILQTNPRYDHITNDGTLEELESKVKELLKPILI